MRKQQAGVSDELNEEMCSYFYRFFHLNLIDLDAKQLVFKIVVEIETVSILHIFPSRILVKDTCFPTGQGLQGTPELTLLCVGTERIIVTITLSQAPAMVVHLYYICQKKPQNTSPMPVAVRISSTLNSSPSLNISRTSVWNKDTCSSFLPCRIQYSV